MNEWTTTGARPIGLYRTAVHYSQMDLHTGTYQHWNGEAWGSIGLSLEQAMELAYKPTKCPPHYWRLIEEGEQIEQRNTLQGHDRRQGIAAGGSNRPLAGSRKESVRSDHAAV